MHVTIEREAAQLLKAAKKAKRKTPLYLEEVLELALNSQGGIMGGDGTFGQFIDSQMFVQGLLKLAAK